MYLPALSPVNNRGIRRVYDVVVQVQVLSVRQTVFVSAEKSKWKLERRWLEVYIRHGPHQHEEDKDSVTSLPRFKHTQ